MTFRNIIHSLVIVFTLILCFAYAQKKGFSFSKHMNNPNWDSFPSNKAAPQNKIDDLKLDKKNEPKKEEKKDEKVEPKQNPKPEEKPQQDEELNEKKEESTPQQSRPKLFRRGRIFSDCDSGGA